MSCCSPFSFYFSEQFSPSGRQESRYGNTADYAAAFDYADATAFVVDYSEVDVFFVLSHPTMNRIAIYSRLLRNMEI